MTTPSNTDNATGLEIFKAGTHTAVDGTTHTFSEAAIAEIAESYDPALSEAPLVAGHPKLDAPAYGWAKALKAQNGMLYAEPHQVDAEFAQLVNAGRMKKISASIYLPSSPGNPKPGKHYLRHIGFLGAQPPAVKGLKSAQFAEGDGALEFSAPWGRLGYTLTDLFQRLRDHLIDTLGIEKTDLIIPQWQIREMGEITRREAGDIADPYYAAPEGGLTLESTTMSQPDKTAEIAAREQQIETQSTALQERERAINEREQTARRNDAVAFAESLVTSGRILPRQRAPIVELLLALPVGTSLSFAEGDQQVTKPAADALRTFLGELPEQMDYAEKSAEPRQQGAVSFAAPDGLMVDPGELQLHARAKAYQAQHPGTGWLAAVQAVGG
ncbi:hypothetical protein [Lysobacter sp. CA199]|uniref:hypothetical protein n=1 Tax=Lysobacter sp. CA199 TaxID=3455608 RepID=UPI003F8D4037